MAQEYRQHLFQPPKGAVDLLLIRHGESQAAVDGVHFPMKDGHGDPALHPNGEQQAFEVGERLKTLPIAAIFVTTLRRKHQTAARLAEVLQITPKVEEDLREIYLGDWDRGIYRKKMAQRDPLFLKSLQNHEWGEIPGAETTSALHARVQASLMRIACAHPDQLVAVFVHGGVIAAALSIATGAKPFAFLGAANGSINRLVINGEHMFVRIFNETGHLD